MRDRYCSTKLLELAEEITYIHKLVITALQSGLRPSFSHH